MNIVYLFVFCLVWINGTSSIDDDKKKESDLFIQDRLIPALMEAKVIRLNFSALRLCMCSTEIGCNTRTHGWLGGMKWNLTQHEKHIYKNTCFTDGDCYQNVRPLPEISHYGCMDQGIYNVETEFHDIAAKTCRNLTSDGNINLWVCCSSNHYCANETLITLPPSLSPTHMSRTTVGVIVFITAIVSIILITLYKWRCFERFDWYIKLLVYLSLTPRERDTKNRHSSNGATVGMQEISLNEQSNATVGTQEISLTERLNATVGMQDLSVLREELNQHMHKLHPDLQHFLRVLDESSGSGCGPIRLHGLTLGREIIIYDKIGRGSFGGVYRGTFRGEVVAVKIFSESQEDSFNHELYIYETRMMRHPNVLRYMGNDRIPKDFGTELWIVFEYHPSRSLYEYLEKKTIDIGTYYCMIRTAVSGLHFIHSRLNINQASSKPAIAHRDIKSRNIMVRYDNSCVIGDFGLSLFEPEDGIIPEAVQKKKSGTTRYLSPEVLNGTMETAVFQSYVLCDMYSFGLVMWEALCRFEDDTITAKADWIPYSDCISRDPQEQDMYNIVCVQKRRPLMNEMWYQHPEAKHIVEIISNCWAENPAARFTAYNCRRKLDERILQLSEEDKEPLLVVTRQLAVDQLLQENNAVRPERETIRAKVLKPKQEKVRLRQEANEAPINGFAGPDNCTDLLLG